MNLLLQLQQNWKRILIILITSFLLIGSVVILKKWQGVYYSYLTRDITAIAELHFFVGFFSQIGIIIWFSSTAISIFSAFINTKQKKLSELRSFLFFSGLLTLLLGVDDAFLVHEDIFPVYLGVDEKIVLAFYGIFLATLLIRYFRLILQTDYILLFMAISLFAMSNIVDSEVFGLHLYLYEDGSKMTGLISWFFYFQSVASNYIKQAIQTEECLVNS